MAMLRVGIAAVVMFMNAAAFAQRYGAVANIAGTVSRPRMKIVRQCAMQSGGGLERSRDGLWPRFEGTYARGDFAVHFFGRPDKLEQMRIVESGSIGFLSR